jgi:hypothetical protein
MFPPAIFWWVLGRHLILLEQSRVRSDSKWCPQVAVVTVLVVVVVVDDGVSGTNFVQEMPITLIHIRDRRIFKIQGCST